MTTGSRRTKAWYLPTIWAVTSLTPPTSTLKIGPTLLSSSAIPISPCPKNTPNGTSQSAPGAIHLINTASLGIAASRTTPYIIPTSSSRKSQTPSPTKAVLSGKATRDPYQRSYLETQKKNQLLIATICIVSMSSLEAFPKERVSDWDGNPMKETTSSIEVMLMLSFTQKETLLLNTKVVLV